MLTTPLCRKLGITYPLMNAPLGGGMAGPELAAAVSTAGGLGFLGLIALAPPYVRHQIRRTRELTRAPFGAGVVLDDPGGAAQIDVCLEERIPALCTFWGDPSPWVAEAHRRGMLLIPQVGSLDEAIAAGGAGVDAIIVQGFEAGGHVRSTTPLGELLPTVVKAVDPVPVIAAGGIADGDGLARALRLGAQAVSMGTRFLASKEAHADPAYKERVVAARASDTILTTLFDLGWPNAAHRVLRNRAVREWEEAGRPPSGKRPGEGTVIGRATIGDRRIDVIKYSVVAPLPGFEGDPENYCLYAGESCEQVKDVRPAAAIVTDVVRRAEAALADGETRR
jgi:nitronate monooxygenase/enoyl-[acyl-carrier protein] reductase II